MFCTIELVLQVTCKECTWSSQHRGHGSESAVGAGKRVTLHLTKMLQRAKILLNMLLTQYDRGAFLNTTLDTEAGDPSIPMDFRYVKLVILFTINCHVMMNFDAIAMSCSVELIR